MKRLGEGSTPGPWRKRIGYTNGEPTEYVIEADNGVLASVYMAVDSEKEDEANADLFTKAPLLVEARDVLAALVEWFPIATQVHGFTATPECFTNARALLAKMEEE